MDEEYNRQLTDVACHLADDMVNEHIFFFPDRRVEQRIQGRKMILI
jgi:hypothetical protein